MRYVPVGCQTYVYVTQRIDVKTNLEQVFREVAEAGYDGIELFASAHETPEDTERARLMSVRFRLPIVAAYLSAALWDAERRAAILQTVNQACANLKRLGGRFLLFGNHHKQSEMTTDDFEEQAKTLSECVVIARTHGLIPAYHTYSPDVANGERMLNETFARAPAELSLAPDLDWILRGGVNPADFLRRWKERIRYLHLRDSRAGRWVEAIGEGDVDFKSLREVIDESEFEGWIVAELAFERDFKPTRSIGESLKLSREHLREAMGF